MTARRCTHCLILIIVSVYPIRAFETLYWKYFLLSTLCLSRLAISKQILSLNRGPEIKVAVRSASSMGDGLGLLSRWKVASCSPQDYQHDDSSDEAPDAMLHSFVQTEIRKVIFFILFFFKIAHLCFCIISIYLLDPLQKKI